MEPIKKYNGTRDMQFLGLATVYVSKAKQTTRRRGRPAKPKVEKQTF